MKSLLSSTIASIRDLNFLQGQMTTFLFMSAITPEILDLSESRVLRGCFLTSLPTTLHMN